MNSDLKITDMEVPESVQKKANDAITIIKTSGERTETLKKFSGNRHLSIRSFFKKPAVIIVAALILLLGTTTVIAASNGFWGWKMADELKSDEPAMETLQEEGIATVFDETEPEVTQDSHDLSIAPIAVVNDGYYAFITFSVTGKGTEEIIKDVNPDVSTYSGSIFSEYTFYLNEEPDRRLGIEAGGIEYKEGSLEFSVKVHINPVFPEETDLRLINKTLHLELSGINKYNEDNGGFETDTDGEWIFDIPLGGADKTLCFEQNEHLNGLEHTLTYLEISPLSAFARYITDPDGSVHWPGIAYITLKDNSVITIGTSDGYLDYEKTKAYSFGQFDQLADISQIKSITFHQQYPDSSQPSGWNERYYTVELENADTY